jgi:excisionase family DNA binding protein
MLNRKDHAGQAVKSQPSDGISPRLLGIPDAARYLGCAVWFVRSLIWGRRVPYVKFGKRYLLDRSDLDNFIDSEKQRG